MNGLVRNTSSLGILKGQTDTLKTPVGILKSPLVLSEVFEFVKKKSPLILILKKIAHFIENGKTII